MPGRKAPAREGQVSRGLFLQVGEAGAAPVPHGAQLPWDGRRSGVRRGRRRQTLLQGQGGQQVPVPASCLSHGTIAAPPSWGLTAAPPC